MGVPIFPVLEGHDRYEFYRGAGWDWKALASCLEDLDGVAGQLSVRPLSEFFAPPSREDAHDFFISPSEVEALGELIDGVWYMDGDPMYTEDAQWFSPSEGLNTVRSLLDYLRLHPNSLAEDSAGVTYQLRAAESALIQAQQEGVGFKMYCPG